MNYSGSYSGIFEWPILPGSAFTVSTSGSTFTVSTSVALSQLFNEAIREHYINNLASQVNFKCLNKLILL